MNAALSLKNRPATPAEQARRLEAFEVAVREDRISELTQERDAAIATAMQTISLQDGDLLQVPDSPFEGANHELAKQLAQHLKTTGLKNVGVVFGDIQLLDEASRRALAEPFLAQQTEDKEKLQAEMERLVVQDNAAARVLAKTQQLLKETQAEVKRLKALEPDRLHKQVKRLQKEKAEAVAGAKELRTNNQQLVKQNRQLNAALDKALTEVNAMELKPEHVFDDKRLGRWELFTCAKNGWYQLLDTENEVSQTVRVEGGELVTPKVRPLPKAIGNQVLEFHREYFGGWA